MFSARAPSVESLPYSASNNSGQSTLSSKPNSKTYQKRSKSAHGNRRADKSPNRAGDKNLSSNGPQFGLDNLTDFFNSFVSFGDEQKASKPRVEVQRKSEPIPGFEPPHYELRPHSEFTTPESFAVPPFTRVTDDNISVSSSDTLYRSAIYLGPEFISTPKANHEGFTAALPFHDSQMSRKSSKRSINSSTSGLKTESSHFTNAINRSLENTKYSRGNVGNSGADFGSLNNMQRKSVASLTSEMSENLSEKRKAKNPLSFLNSSFLSLQVDLSKSKKEDLLKNRQSSTLSLKDTNFRSQKVSNVLLNSVKSSLINLNQFGSGIYDQPHCLKTSNMSLASNSKYPSIRNLLESQEVLVNEVYGSNVSFAENSPKKREISRENSRSRNSISNKRSPGRVDKRSNSKKNLQREDVDIFPISQENPIYQEVYPKINPPGSSIQSLHCLNQREINRYSKQNPDANFVLQRNSRSSATLILPNKFTPSSLTPGSKRVGLSPGRNQSRDGSGSQKMSPNMGKKFNSEFHSDVVLESEKPRSRQRYSDIRVETEENFARESGYYSSLSPIATNEVFKPNDNTNKNEESRASRQPIGIRVARSTETDFKFIDDSSETPIMSHKQFASSCTTITNQMAIDYNLMESVNQMSDSGNYDGFSVKTADSLDENLVSMIEDEQPQNLMEIPQTSNNTNLIHFQESGMEIDNIPFIDNDAGTLEPSFGTDQISQNYLKETSLVFREENEQGRESSVDEYREQSLAENVDRGRENLNFDEFENDDLITSPNDRNEYLAEKRTPSEFQPQQWHSFSKSVSISLACVPGLNYLQAMDNSTLSFMAYYSFLPVLHDTCVSLKLVPKKFK